MEQVILFSILSFGIAFLLAWLIATGNYRTKLQQLKESQFLQLSNLEKELVSLKAISSTQLSGNAAKIEALENQLQSSAVIVKEKVDLCADVMNQLAVTSACLNSTNENFLQKENEVFALKADLERRLAERDQLNLALAKAQAENRALQESQMSQNATIEKLNEKFNLEFENIANKIFESKTQKFTDLNRNNLKEILDPLGRNIDAFKKQVDEVYSNESKERFSLGERVKELTNLNSQLRDEAKNLTKALKGEAKTQGRWGEMILESILEKSGLVKGREYFMEHELLDANGVALRSESEGKKMRPDAVIKYPDNRSVIIDSKMSLNAFARLIASDDVDEQKLELEAHIQAIKNHILMLSTKGYDDYDASLDFVLMFVPSEPAYIAAMQGDSNLWNFAYDKRILLLSPTNLITSLKLIVDLWKREYQNQNAKDIADRGAKMYDKFVGFVEKLQDVGDHLHKAQAKYHEAYKQLDTGNDNLVLQASKLKALGLKTKKDLPIGLVESSQKSESID